MPETEARAAYTAALRESSQVGAQIAQDHVQIEEQRERRSKRDALLVLDNDLIALEHPQLLGLLGHLRNAVGEHGREERRQEQLDEKEILDEDDPGPDARLHTLVVDAVLVEARIGVGEVNTIGEVNALVGLVRMAGHAAGHALRRGRLQLVLVEHEDLQDTAE